MDIYFLRHAQSLYNADPSDDMIDCPLTDLGKKQATDLKETDYPKHYDLIVCSPLRRCLETLKYSTITYDQLEINDLFREIRSGCKSDLLNLEESVLIETEQDLQTRIDQINDYLTKKKSENLSNILLVTHSDLVWRLSSYDVEGEMFGIWLNNAQIYHWKKV